MTYSLPLAVAALAVLSMAPGPADPPPTPTPLPWLDVTLPAAPSRGPTAKADLVLDTVGAFDHSYSGIRLTIGKAAPRLVPLDQRVQLVVAANATEPLRLEINGIQALAHVRPGDKLILRAGHDGGWFAAIGNRMAEAAPKNLTRCVKPHETCPEGYSWTNAYKGDAVCPVPPDEIYTHKCVRSPTVRARGPLFDAVAGVDEGSVPLTLNPIAAGELGPPMAIEYGREGVPLVHLDNAEAFLIVGPGDACEVWLHHGRVESRLLPAK
jgi:hypothetical protein